MRGSYDVIVLGAGPAGATLAYELAKKGIRVLLVEKEILPRYKCCAGGVSVRAAKLLSVNIQELAEEVVSDVIVSFGGGSHYHGCCDKPLMYTVMRDRFDYALVKQAEEAGAVIIQEQKAEQIHIGAGWIEVSTAAGDFRSQFVARADGARSVLAGQLGLEGSTSYITGIQTEVVVTEAELAKWKSQIRMDMGFVRGGYAWAFPKLDHLSIGIACLSSRANGLQRYYEEFLHSLNIGNYTIARRSGGLIPTCRRKAVVSHDRVVLLGDAAGLSDPLTGEGIYNAIRSAKLAVPVIEESLLHGEVRLENYQHAVEEEIMPEIEIARVLSRLFVRFPTLAFKLLSQDERVWRGCCRLVRGEIDYTTIKQRLGGFKGIYALLSRR